MYDITGKTAVVTGAARGIGEAIARTLSGAGAKLVICDMDGEGAAAVAESLKAAGREAVSLQANITVEDDAKRLVADTLNAFGQVDILVNNAGITRDNLIVRMKDEEWDLVLDVNLKGVFRVTRAFAQTMMKARNGSIVNVSSVVGLIGNAGQANYAASKGGVIALTKACAKELSPRGIRVNAIAPGFISTAMTDKLTQEQRDAFLKTIPLGRAGTVEDVANVVLFLASDASSYLTGQVIKIDGGLAM